MEKILNELIKAREKAGLSLEDIHDRTLIPLRQLSLLEAGEFTKIGPPVYIKGFMRRYAQEVGIDPDSLWQVESSAMPLAPPVKTKHSPQIFRNYLLSALRILVIMAIFVLVGVLIYRAVISSRDPGLPTPPSPPGPEEPAPEPQPEPEPEPEPEPQPTLEQVSADASEAIYLVKNTSTLAITIDFTGNCWTRITAGNQKIGEKTFTAGQQHQVASAETVRIRFGAPINARVTVNGLPIELPALRAGFNLEIRPDPGQ